MANIRIKDLPADSAPKADDKVPIDLGTTRNTTVEEFVFAGRPTATKTEAEAGTDNKKAMTPLAVKQAIDAQTGMRYVPVTRRVDSGAGLSGGQELTGDVTLSLNSASVASLSKADSAVQSVNGKSGNSVTITPADVGAAPSSIVADVNANTAERHTHTNKAILDATTASFLAAEKTKLSGIAAGAQVNTVNSVNTKTGDVILGASDVGAATSSQGAKADTALQAPGGTTGQILAKNSNTTNDVAWVSSEAATAVSYGPQILTEAQKTQARANIGAVIASEVTKADVGLGNVANKTEAQMVASGAIADALGGKQPALGFTPVQQGGGTGQGTDKLHIGWMGSSLGFQVGSTNFGDTWPINITGQSTFSSNAGLINGLSVRDTIATHGPNQVGTYAFLRTHQTSNVNPGETWSGGTLYYANGAGAGALSVGSGSWKCMGNAATGGPAQNSTLWLRYA